MGADHSKFGVLILSHGRPDNQRTLRALTKAGYTGPIWWVLDDQDDTVDQYRALYGAERVVVFDKTNAVADTADPTDDRRVVVYARNASFGIARDLGLDYFLQLDDDYNWFAHRLAHDGKLRAAMFTDMDAINEAMLTFLDDTGAASVAMSQGGDWMGGAASPYLTNRTLVLRKVMNTFYFRTDRPVTFLGQINEDVCLYVTAGSRGDLFFTVLSLSIDQAQTQEQDGGLTDIYLDSGTYVKSFYTLMMAPSCVSITTMGRTSRRFHHSIRWDHAVPKILSDRHRKAQPRRGRPRAKASP